MIQLQKGFAMAKSEILNLLYTTITFTRWEERMGRKNKMEERRIYVRKNERESPFPRSWVLPFRLTLL